MCENEKSCDICLKIRFVKPEEGGRSFCVTMKESHEVGYNVKRSFGLTTTHKEKTKECDHPEEFVKLG